MNAKKMALQEVTTLHASTSLRTAALTAGFSLLLMVVVAPFAELYAYPKLVDYNNISGTIANLSAHKDLFLAVLFGYLITFICDIVVAWALYILLTPVHAPLSLLAALFRWVYTVIALVALLNLVTVFRLVNASDYKNLFSGNELNTQVWFLLKLFKAHWYFGLLFFSIHLMLLGYLVIRSDYIPSILGILLIITGVGYLLTNIKPYLFPSINIDFASFTFYGELVFMLWLLLKGWHLNRRTGPEK